MSDIVKSAELFMSAIEEALADYQTKADALQEKIDDLEDKQAERETEARQAKIDDLAEKLEPYQSILEMLDGAQAAVEELLSAINDLP